MSESTAQISVESTPAPVCDNKQPWDYFARLPEHILARRDVGMMNLACACGLPGMESMNPSACLSRLNECAKIVQYCTNKNFRKFKMKPEEYENSEAYFRVLVLISVLQRQCGLRYDPAKIDENIPFTIADSFIE